MTTKVDPLTSLIQLQSPIFFKFYSLLQQFTDADLGKWLDLAGNRNSQILADEIIRTLKFWDNQFTKVLQNTEQKEQDQALATLLEFTSCLADLSPSFKQLLGDLYQLKLQELKTNAEKQQRLLQTIASALQSAQLNQIQLEIIKATRLALLQAKRFCMPSSKPSLSPMHKAAKDELEAFTKVAVESADNQAAFEKLRKIGWMWAILAQHFLIAEFEATLYPDAKFEHQRSTDPAPRNRYLDFQHQKYRGTQGEVLMPGAAPAAASLPPGFKPGL